MRLGLLHLFFKAVVEPPHSIHILGRFGRTSPDLSRVRLWMRDFEDENIRQNLDGHVVAHCTGVHMGNLVLAITPANAKSLLSVSLLCSFCKPSLRLVSIHQCPLFF